MPATLDHNGDDPNRLHRWAIDLASMNAASQILASFNRRTLEEMFLNDLPS